MTRLPDLLTEHDLPIAELHAARLDGLVQSIGGDFRAADRPEVLADRVRAIASQVPHRMIVCEESAAWIWGAIGRAPQPLRLCSPPRHRARLIPSALVVARELRLQPHETVELTAPGPLPRVITVTTALRTAVDLARAAARPLASTALHAMIIDGLVRPDDVRAALDLDRRRPGRIAAIAAVERAEHDGRLRDQPSS